MTDRLSKNKSLFNAKEYFAGSIAFLAIQTTGNLCVYFYMIYCISNKSHRN